MKKEDFIENILNSTNGITKVSPNDVLLIKIQTKIEDEKPVESYTKWLVAASIIILISLNFILFFGSSKSNYSEMTSIENSINKSNQLYK